MKGLKVKHSAKKATFELLDELPDGEVFRGIYLQKEIKRRTGELHYPDTYLRYLRDYRRKKGRMIINTNKAKSIYTIGLKG